MAQIKVALYARGSAGDPKEVAEVISLISRKQNTGTPTNNMV